MAEAAVAKDGAAREERVPASVRLPEDGPLTGALASKARSCADIIQAKQGAIVAQGAAVLE